MNSAQLESTLSDSLRDTRLIVVANREPYIHVRRSATARGIWNWMRGRRETDGIEWMRPASGLVTALDPVMRACGGTWVAHGSGDADRETADAQRPRRGAAGRPVVHAAPRLADAGRRAGLLLRLRQQRAVAAVPHRLRAPGVRRGATGSSTCSVNRRFADAVLEEVGDDRGDRVRAGLPLRAAAAVPQGGAAGRDGLPVLAHPVAEPRSVPRLPVGRRDPARPARQRPARRSTSSTTATTSSTPWTARSSPASTTSTSRSWRGGQPTFVKPFPISIDPVAVEGPGQARRPGRRGRARRAQALGLRRRADHLRRRSARLHQGHPRSPAGVRAAARAPPRVARAA